MWAVVKINSKQYRVKEKDLLEVDSLNPKEGQKKFEFDKVLLLCNKKDVIIGQPYVENAKVEAELVSVGKSRKVTVFTYKRRKGYKRKKGHRQIVSRLKILKIKD